MARFPVVVWYLGSDMSDSPDGKQQMKLLVRDAIPDDLPVIHRMIHELANHEGMPDGPELTVDELRRDGFESSPAWYMSLVVEVNERIVGYAIFNRAYSSWTRRAYYLEDIYVLPDSRRTGAALALMRELCSRAASEGVTRLDWHMLRTNTSAIAFYTKLGARDLLSSENRLAMRLDGPQIMAIANPGS